MTKAYRKALELQTLICENFTYVSDTKKSGQGEQFDEESERLLQGLDFFGDCDTATNTVAKHCEKKACYPIEDIALMVTPNHYIGMIIDDELNDGWVFENTGFEFTRKALNSKDFPTILGMPTKDKMKFGFIEPKVYRLSELQKGLVIPEKHGRAYMVPSMVKHYFMEEFMTLDESMGGKWWHKRDDLPFLTDFVIRDFIPDSAENINRKRDYTFTKEWEAQFKINVGFFKIDGTYDSEREDKLQIEGGFNFKGSHERVVYHNSVIPNETLSDKQWIFLKNVARLIDYADSIGFKLTGGELQRTLYQQKEYMRQGRSQTMNSKHLKKLAIDLFTFIDGDLTWSKSAIQPLGDYWESLDNRNEWGGNWKSIHDTVHFQMNEEDKG